MVYYETWLSVEEEIKQYDELEDIRISCALLKDDIENSYSSEWKKDFINNKMHNKNHCHNINSARDGTIVVKRSEELGKKNEESDKKKKFLNKFGKKIKK